MLIMVASTRGIWYFRDGKSVVISFSHPEARVKDAYLFYALTDAVKEIMRCEEFEEQEADFVLEHLKGQELQMPVVILWSAKKYSIIGRGTYVPLKSVRRCGECRSRHAVM